MTAADTVAVPLADATATPRRDWAAAVKAVALSVRCPVLACGAAKGQPCICSGESPHEYHYLRLDFGLAAEMPHLRDARDDRRALRRRWARAVQA